MGAPTLTDPVLGTLSYQRDWYEWSHWVGRVEFKPGVWVELTFNEWKYGNENSDEQLAKCREVYLKLQECEHGLRLDAVIDFMLAKEWPGVSDIDEVTDAQFDEYADQFRLIRVSLHSEGSAGLDYTGPQDVLKGRELHISSDDGEFAGRSFNEPPAAPPPRRGVVEVLRETELFQAVARQYPGVEIWPDPEAPDDGHEYAWIMSVEGKAATNLAYFRLKGDSLQLKIRNHNDETRWLDLAGQWLDNLLTHIRPRWRFS